MSFSFSQNICPRCGIDHGYPKYEFLGVETILCPNIATDAIEVYQICGILNKEEPRKDFEEIDAFCKEEYGLFDKQEKYARLVVAEAKRQILRELKK